MRNSNDLTLSPDERQQSRLISELLYQRAANSAVPTDYVNWAASMLDAGADSKNLRILAGLPEPLSSFEVEFHFQRAVSELDRTIGKPEEDIRAFISMIAQDIISGSTGPVEGCKRIFEAVSTVNQPPDLWNWVLLYYRWDDAYEFNSYSGLLAEKLDADIMQEAIAVLSATEA